MRRCLAANTPTMRPISVVKVSTLVRSTQFAASTDQIVLYTTTASKKSENHPSARPRCIGKFGLHGIRLSLFELPSSEIGSAMIFERRSIVASFIASNSIEHNAPRELVLALQLGRLYI